MIFGRLASANGFSDRIAITDFNRGEFCRHGEGHRKEGVGDLDVAVSHFL